MSLATRCNSCGTVFRVVQDQLKISEGWVRCGRCNAVFNALEGLFDLGREPESGSEPGSDSVNAVQPVVEPGGETGPTHDMREARGEPPPEIVDDDDDDGGPLTAPLEFGDHEVDPIDAHLFRKRGAEAERATTVQVDKRDRHEFSDARFDSDLFAESPSGDDDPTLLMPPTTAAGDLPLEGGTIQPEFVRRAERRARWKSKPVQTALASLCVLAALGLGLQVAHHFRNSMAAHWPSTRPALLAWCRLAACSVDAPSSIDDLTLEHTDLTRAVGVDAFVFSVTLRSHGAVALKVPSVDLSLTDGNGRLVARRALSPRDFGAAALIQPGAEAVMQLMVNAGSARVSGFTAEIFYP
jgi:predicted Zn finger-like uncharacterized protein